jgi:hypothetical protein
MKIRYEAWSPGPDARAIIRQAETICADFRARGYDLTLRQLYYQFVARAVIPNNLRSYKRLGDIVNRARLAGMLDWIYIVDRTRNLRSVGHWSNPQAIIEAAASSFALDKWRSQSTRIEVWAEKEALAGIVGQVAERNDVAWFSCRGYVSQSEIWSAAQRHLGYIEGGQNVVVLHLGDHDPSGIDMTRDIRDRLTQFLDHDWLNRHSDDFPTNVWTYNEDGTRSTTIGRIREHLRSHLAGRDPIEVRRIALNFDQVEHYDPPPNPAKMTDSRANGYVDLHGYESWELDALDPDVLDSLIEEHILAERDDDAYAAVEGNEDEHRGLLLRTASRWTEVTDLVGDTS